MSQAKINAGEWKIKIMQISIFNYYYIHFFTVIKFEDIVVINERLYKLVRRRPLCRVTLKNWRDSVLNVKLSDSELAKISHIHRGL